MSKTMVIMQYLNPLAYVQGIKSKGINLGDGKYARKRGTCRETPTHLVAG